MRGICGSNQSVSWIPAFLIRNQGLSGDFSPEEVDAVFDSFARALPSASVDLETVLSAAASVSFEGCEVFSAADSDCFALLLESASTTARGFPILPPLQSRPISLRVPENVASW